MSHRIRVSWCVIVALLAVCCFGATARASPFLSAEIENALSARTEFLQEVGLTDADLLALSSWLTLNGGGALAERLSYLGGAGSPWYFYVRGLISENSDVYYKKALSAAESDPGVLWLLGLEYIRYNQFQWAASAFTGVEKWILANGGASAPFLAQQLMLMGNVFSAQSTERADFCYTWAKRFDGNQYWWLYKKGLLDFPSNLFGAIPGLAGEVTGVFLKSWRAQIALISGAYRFFTTAIFIFVFAIIAVFAVKYLPSGVHRIGDTLFLWASPRFRTISSVVIILSTFIISPLLTLWLIAFLICEFLSTAEKKLLVLVCTLLALIPLNTYVTNLLQRTLNPSSPALLLDRAINEGYSEGLHELIAANVQKKPGNYVNQLALAITASKNDEHNGQGVDAIKMVYQAAPDDPLVLLYAGNISFLAGHVSDMEQFYEELIKKHPKSAEGKFNLALAHVKRAGFAATDMISDAAKLNPTLIGEFMRENERFFDSDPPPLRKAMQQSISPGYFWGNLYFADFMDIFDVEQSGNTVAVFILFVTLYVGFLALYFTVWSSKSKIKKYFICRVCGQLLCKKCRKGTMCSVCYRECLDNQNNAAAMYNLQNRHQQNAQAVRDYTKFALGAVYPGAEKLYDGETMFKPAFAIFVTSLIFAAFYCAFTFTTNYPSRTVINLVHYVLIFGIYNIVAVIRQSLWLTKMLRMRAKMAVKQV